jgi:membrane-associated phospholipid phosphatase
MKFLILSLLSSFFSIISFSQNVDIDILKQINLNRNTKLDGTFRTITNSASPVAYGVPLVLLSIALIKKDSSLKRNTIYIGTSVVVSTGISTILKYAVNRDRPFVTYPFLQNVTEGGSASFPSGHTTDAFSLATSISIAYPKWYVIVPAYLWAGAVGYSRMDLGVHYPSDVLAGAIIGSATSYLFYKTNKWLNKSKKQKIIFSNGLQ